MNKFLKSFSSKKFKHGAFSTLTTLFVVAILLVVNLIAGQLDISYDLTPDKTYSISKETKEILDGTEDNITVYALFNTGDTGMRTDMYRELLDQYSSYSDQIKIEYKDPLIYPQFVSEYATNDEEVPTGSIIVKSDKRHKIIPANKLVSTQFNQQTFTEQVVSVDIEPQVSNAIVYVTQENTPIIYTVTGHDEAPLTEGLKNEISLANYETKELDLLKENAVPEDCSLLFVTTPSRDWTPAEAENVKTYLQNDGRAVFFINNVQFPLENLNTVLVAYGVELNNAFVVEGNTSNYYPGQSALNLLPNYIEHDITTPLAEKGYRAFTPFSQGIVEAGLKKNSIKVEPLLMTTADSYGKISSAAQSINKEEGDLDGPFYVAVAVTDSFYTEKEHTAKLIVMGQEFMLDESANLSVSGSNYRFIISAINWTQDKESSIYISPKSSSVQPLQMTQQQANMIALFSAIILPVVIIGVGCFVWLRRRNS